MNSKNYLSSIDFENYRIFKERGTIKVNNLTLLFGYNNAGKSALIRLFPFLSDSFKSKRPKCYTKSYMDYSSASLRGAMFDDIKNKTARKIKFGLHWSSGIGINFALQQDGTEAERLTELFLSRDSKTTKFEPSIENENIYENTSDRSHTIQMSSFSEVSDKDLRNQLSQFSESVHWISSTRVHPPREFEIGIGVKVGLEPDGSGIGETIWYLAETNSPSFLDINKWLNQTCDRHFDFKSSSSSVTSTGRRKVKLETVAKHGKSGLSPIKIGILDSGEGIAQALPVVTICAMAANNELGEFPVVVIEQPELHLHPKAIVVLANFIVECSVKNESARFIIETHSESFLLALQTAMVDKRLNIEDFSCYWVGCENNVSHVNEVKFDENGYILGNWPQSVFREVINQSKDLIKKRRSIEG